MRTITIEHEAGAPYERLRDAVRKQIERGTMLPGDRLPTVRGLADTLGLAPNTVARAYRELEAGGWIVGRGRAGTFVADSLPRRLAAPERDLAKAAAAFARRAAQLGFDHAAAARAFRDVDPRF
ncbi:MAG TPA: GntR family transcriptional regulator [Actinomycetota bacterium]|nr:GntR family transcriptional regulator [Actinomycetota bacterium]